MKRIINAIRRFFTSLGLVEQSQVVASTAVVVAMLTIITAHFGMSQSLGWLDFISIVTVGVIGFVSVFFTVKYGRQLEEQRRELLALNTIAESVNHSVELNYVMHSALLKVMELMRADFGWIYLLDTDHPVLKHQSGTAVKFFSSDVSVNSDAMAWVRQPSLHRLADLRIEECLSPECKGIGVKAVGSIPLERQGTLAGMLIIAGKEEKSFVQGKIALLQAFGNQVSVALHNASLFEQVKLSERRYADLYEHSPDMYHSVDRRGIIANCNLTESEVLGIRKEDIIGRPLLKLYPEAQHDHVRKNLEKLFERGEELKDVEEQVQKHDGTLIDVSVNSSIVYDPDGSPSLARMVLRDITEKKRMEAKILQAQKIDSIGNLAGGVAHDFNNILTSILGSASIMRRKLKDDPRWMKYVDLIETSSRRGAAVTRQLLTFARKTNPHVRLVDMNTLIDQTLRLFEATTTKAISIKYVPYTEAVVVMGDEGQLQQALLNLCLNARDAMPNGGTLSIRCGPVFLNERQANQFAEGKMGDYVMISVADTGAGISKGILHRIFEPFFTTKEATKGTGLGLSVVHGVVRSHNGYINVESEINSGTIFTIYLPRISGREPLKGEQRRSREPVGGNERLLLIEDEASVSEVGVDILTDLGYYVEKASDGKEAMEKLASMQPPFDLVILDMNMPRMDGRATIEFIKQQHSGLKVLVCSGYSEAMVGEGKFMELIDGFIQKPYESEDLALKVRFLLDGRPE